MNRDGREIIALQRVIFLHIIKKQIRKIQKANYNSLNFVHVKEQYQNFLMKLKSPKGRKCFKQQQVIGTILPAVKFNKAPYTFAHKQYTKHHHETEHNTMKQNTKSRSYITIRIHKHNNKNI